MEPEGLFAGHPAGMVILDRVLAAVEALGPVEIRTSQSQVAFRRARGFARPWRPGQYLAGSTAEAVLSIALGRLDPSPRWKEIVHPSPKHWIHHLELHDPEEVDEEVTGWLREAADRAG